MRVCSISTSPVPVMHKKQMPAVPARRPGRRSTDEGWCWEMCLKVAILPLAHASTHGRCPELSK
eukprot:CAMPEP_0168445922 /NCGR_PEP_ID=MMETSP0228-20121227/45812_1 /TAXON_ID=133427 /ORGANISM="Protoceratium reticulatum, Strain CCCM 535 (=CCMP 1889)" /LENGTH=63 /DNA_ID=CAMNT_0008460407 /DNA_START=19 /DNA_END=207 /DNA_ORIENTATION=-